MNECCLYSKRILNRVENFENEILKWMEELI